MNVLTDAQMSIPEEVFECNRCGICCTRFHVCLTFVEAHRIADGLGISWNEFRKVYLELNDFGDTAYLIRHEFGACIFLLIEEDQSTVCTIQSFKPLSCIEWNASLERSICREGRMRRQNRQLNPDLKIAPKRG